MANARYRSTPPTIADGDLGEILLDANGRVVTTPTSGGTAQDVNVTKLGGTSIDTNSGNKSAGTQRVVLATDQPALSTAMPVTLATKIAGEDLNNDVTKVEQRYLYKQLTADGQVKATAGFVHTVTFSATGTVTAGVVTLYDNTAESGTVIWSGVIQTGLNPTTIILDCTFTTGLYVGYDGTIANVATTVSYR